MEALAAVGLVANLIQFVELGARLIGSAKEMKVSASGMTPENKSLDEVTIEMRGLAQRLQPPTTEANSDDERALHVLARECRELSEQILRVLKKIAPTKSNSRRHYMLSAIRNYKYKDEKRELEERLARCSSQLHLHLNVLKSSEVQAQLRNLEKSGQSSRAMLRALPQQIKEMRQDTRVTSLSAESLDQIKMLLRLTELPREASTINQILRFLAFDEMRARSETIEEQHCDTFRWIVDPGVKVDNTTLASNARELYLSWLSRGRGTFHIAGKLGSGKSTLMKFLFAHSETQKQLLVWAGEAKLVMVNHFFWKPGKESLQKSFNGMIRSLLYDILNAHPELIRITFPELWATIMETSFGNEHIIRMRPNDIYDGFMALLKDEAVQKSYRFCFFIDALDEFEDTRQHDDKYMVDELRSWAQISPNTIKLCVSSREHNVFENAFADGRRIRLQELTRHDMECFTRSMLRHMHDDATRERFTHDIVNRSDGIFLWVALVVKQLRQALEDGRDTSSFEEELSTLPTELENLFKHLLRSIPKSQRNKAYQIFAMVQEHETSPTKLSLLSCLFLESYQADRQFATKGLSTLPDLDTQDEHELHTAYEAQVKKARTLLQGYCKGLVEDRPAPEVHKHGDVLRIGDRPTHRWKLSSSPECQKTYPGHSKPAGSRCILFVHRTIVEFLERSTGLKTVARQSDEFDVVEAISQLHLAEAQSIPRSLINPRYWSSMYGSLLDLRFRAGKDRSRFDFLVQLNELVSTKFPGLLETRLPPASENASQIEYHYHAMFSLETHYSHTPESEGTEIPFNDPLYISAWLGNASYVLWEIQRRSDSPPSDRTVGIILHCLQYSLRRTTRLKDYDAIMICFDELLDFRDSPTTHFLWPQILLHCSLSDRHDDIAWSWTMGHLIEMFVEDCKETQFHTTKMAIDSDDVYIAADSEMLIRISVGGEYISTQSFPNHLCATPIGGLLQNKYGTAVPLPELVGFWGFMNMDKICELIGIAYEESNNSGEQSDLSDSTPASESPSKSLERIDSVTGIRSQSHVALSLSYVKTSADIAPAPLQSQAPKSRSGRTIGIVTLTTLLVILSAFMIAHQDYWGRWSSIVVHEPARIVTEAYYKGVDTVRRHYQSL